MKTGQPFNVLLLPSTPGGEENLHSYTILNAGTLGIIQETTSYAACLQQLRGRLCSCN